MAEMTFLPIPDDDRIKYCIDTILKEAKLEDVLVKQLFYAMLSMYTNDPRNVQVTGPSGYSPKRMLSSLWICPKSRYSIGLVNSL